MKSSSQLAESKLIILYMLDKVGVPMSLSYIQDFALASEYMDYFSLSNYLGELNERDYIEKKQEHNRTTYAITENGLNTLQLFKNLIPDAKKDKIDNYVLINKNEIKKDLEIVANYKKHNNEYLVECFVYENKVSIMEIKLRVVSKKYANKICDNWKKDASKYYLEFIKSLLIDETEKS